MFYLAASSQNWPLARALSEHYPTTFKWWEHLKSPDSQWEGICHRCHSGIRLSTTVIGLIDPLRCTSGVFYELGFARGLRRQVVLVSLFPQKPHPPEAFMLSDRYWQARTLFAFRDLKRADGRLVTGRRQYTSATLDQRVEAIKLCLDRCLPSVPLGDYTPRPVPENALGGPK